MSSALVQAPFLFSVLTSEVVETKMKMQFITIIFLNQQSKVSTFISQDLKHSCYSWYFSVVLTSMLVAMIRMMMSMREIENINIMNVTLFE